MLQHCPTCSHLKKPVSTPSGSLRDRWREFNDSLAVDLFMLTDAKGVHKTFLDMVDMASKYQIMTPMGVQTSGAV